jgi:hypothetical protein
MVTLDQVLPFQWKNAGVTVAFGVLVSSTAHASSLAGAAMASNSGPREASRPFALIVLSFLPAFLPAASSTPNAGHELMGS